MSDLQGDLFAGETAYPDAPDRGAPLAERLRPETLDEILGQERLLGEGGLLRDLLEQDRLPSMILWGPPGCGKTTLARLMARSTRKHFTAFSAVLSGVKEVRQVIAEAEERRRKTGQGTLLFVDEIHRFNKSQQDAFLAHVESGVITLVGATTENPSFEINSALLSRCQVFVLAAHDEASLAAIARRALDRAAELGLPEHVGISDDGIRHLARTSGGDARSLLNRLEALLAKAGRRNTAATELSGEDVAKLLQDRTLRYDKAGEEHFNIMSAFHKSLRGGDPQAALYWLARMLEGGEDPLWVARRIVRCASEDIGLADPQALRIALDAKSTFEFLGVPEGLLALAEAAVYLATAPKSNAVYKAFNAAVEDVRAGRVFDVPVHLRNAPTKFMKDQGYGSGYKYPHDFDEAIADQSYLPGPLAGRAYYEPSPFGYEKDVQRRIDYWNELKKKLREKSDE